MNPAAGVERRHDIDALRVFAFALLILYHVGMFYVPDWGWHVKSTHTFEWLKLPMTVLNQWRMPLLFLISGVAVHFLLRRLDAGRFAWARTRRLLLPLLFGMAVVVPPQAYFQALANGAFEGGYLDFLVAYFTFQPWPPGAFDGSHVGVTWNHLWYLPYLLVYSLLLAALLPLLRSRAGLAFAARWRGLRGWRLWLLPVAPLVLATWTLSARFPTTHDLLHDWHTHAQYGAMFLYGYWIGADAGLWGELRRRRWWLLGGCGRHLHFVLVAALGHGARAERGPGDVRHRPAAQRLDLDPAGAGVGPPSAEPAVPLAAVRDRRGIPLVRVAPDGHRGRRRMAGIAAARTVAGAAVGGGRDRARLRAADRIRDPPRRLAAAIVRDEATAIAEN